MISSTISTFSPSMDSSRSVMRRTMPGSICFRSPSLDTDIKINENRHRDAFCATSHARETCYLLKCQMIFTAHRSWSALICAPSSLILLVTSSSVNITPNLVTPFSLFLHVYTLQKMCFVLQCYLVCFTDALTESPTKYGLPSASSTS